MSAVPAASSRPVVLDDATLRVVADPLRARIVELLATERLCTCHLVDELGVGQSNVSNHLRVLREAGVVRAEPAGRYTYYALEPRVLDVLADRLHDLAVAARAAVARRRPCP
jgi:ArsR family transcriptional regulator